MLQMSKILMSREEWKRKATQRAEESCEFRKSQKRHQKRIAELKAQVAQLEKQITEKKTKGRK